jgi:hypothetical protein
MHYPEASIAHRILLPRSAHLSVNEETVAKTANFSPDRLFDVRLVIRATGQGVTVQYARDQSTNVREFSLSKASRSSGGRTQTNAAGLSRQGANGIPFLLHVNPVRSRACSALFPGGPFFRRSTNTGCLAPLWDTNSKVYLEPYLSLAHFMVSGI